MLLSINLLAEKFGFRRDISKSIETVDGRHILLRYIRKEDLRSLWNNYNYVVDEKRYLPVFEKVLTAYERELWYSDLIANRNICIVAEDPELPPGDRVVGQCIIEAVEWDAARHVGGLGIIIRKNYRGVGIGRQLMIFTISEAYKSGKKKIILSAFASNINAIKLYEKLGFRKVGVRSKQFYMNGKFIDELIMELWIEDYPDIYSVWENDKYQYTR